ncbi:MAG: GNAT family N-acetyltransferase [Lentisphaeria bacterium]
MTREICPEDFAEASRILAEAFEPIFLSLQEQMGNVFQAFYPDPATNRGENLRSHYEQYPDQILVAERAGKMVGVVTYLLDSKRRIGTICMNAADQHTDEKGVGQEMYAAVFERFRTAGMKYAQVSTGGDSAHAAARRAYERAGFQNSTLSVNYYREL